MVAAALDLAVVAAAAAVVATALLVPLDHLQHRVLVVLAGYISWSVILSMAVLVAAAADWATLGLRASVADERAALGVLAATV